MNRVIFYASLFIFSFALLFAAVSSRTGVLRLHVIANSDSPRDQALKLLVRDCVLETERERLEDAQSGEQAAERVMADAATLLSRVDSVLRENGCTYGARLCLGIYPFPSRRYANRLYPEGDYTALRIVLGEGAGQNWWCVLFPPLCILENKAGEIEYTETGNIQWKSLLREWMGKGEKEDEKAPMDECGSADVHSISSDAYLHHGGGSGVAQAGQQG